MLALKEAQIDVPNQLTEEQIIEQVLGTRRGHNRGRGQVVRRANSSSIVLAERSSSSVGNMLWAQSSVGERSYTQAEVDSLVASTSSRLETKLNVLLRGLKANNIEIEFEEDESGDEESDEDEG